MILKIRNWCEGIIIAIIISIIIELLIPSGSNKKYVKVVSGIYIMFVVLNPILEILKYDINFENMFEFKNVEVSANVNEDLKDVYVIGIKESIKKEIENLGYKVEFLEIFVDSNYENIEKIELKVCPQKKKIKTIEKVEIDNNTEKLNNEYIDIINLLKENYLIEYEKIIFLDT